MRQIILILAVASAAFAQLDSNVVTVTVSRQLVVQPDKVSLTVYVTSPADQTLDQVLAALRETRIKAADLTNFSTQGPALTWVFGPVLPFSDMKAVLPALEGLVSSGPIGVQLYFVGAAVSAEAAASQQCPYPELINDARSRAGKLAAAVGGTLGPIVSLTSGTAGTVAILDPATVALLRNPFPGEIVAPSCALNIQFHLIQ